VYWRRLRGGLSKLAATGEESSLPRRTLAVLVSNLASHPLLWFFFARVVASRGTMLAAAESWA
jgi:hypothetical protein